MGRKSAHPTKLDILFLIDYFVANMCDEIITLWTLHSPDFDLTSGRIDHSKSEYYSSVPGVKEAYCELWRRLNTPAGQIIWCYTENGAIAKTGIEKILWELQIPRENVICFLDSLVWNRILGIKCGVGNTMRRQWITEAVEKYPEDSHSYIDVLRIFGIKNQRQVPGGMSCSFKTLGSV